jgi:fumarate reductase flavoprotein subunit
MIKGGVTSMSSRGTEKMGNLEANIVIIGSGGGLVAAAAAAEKGVKGIIVLEEKGSLGGVTKMAQGFFACESPVQQQEQIIVDKDVVFKTYMNWDHWAKINPRVLRAYINKSGDTVRWFQEKGIHFELKMHTINQTRVLHWPLKGKGPEFGRGAELIRVLTKECREHGVELLTHTMAKRLVRDAQGNMAGVVAVRDGQDFEIKTRSAIIATGGFSGDVELLKKYCPDYDESSPTGELGKHLTGDPDWDETGELATHRAVEGLRMAEEIGAAIAKDVPFPSHGGLDYRVKGALAVDKNEPLVHIPGEPYTVKVNKLGRRYVDEGVGGAGAADALQPGKVTFTLFDDRIRRDMEEKGVLIGKGWGRDENVVRTGLPGLEKALRKWSERGEESVAKITDSWDEMAKWMGADPGVLKAEIDEYNTYCDQGYDEIFAKERRFLRPLRTPPYYGLRSGGGGWGETMGGIKVNERMEVIDTQYKAIPGLYAAGVIADGWTGKIYCGEYPGTGLGFTVNSGRIAGENAAEYVFRK